MKKIMKEKKHWVILGIASLMYMGSLGLVTNTIGVYYTPVSNDLNILTGTFSMNATLASVFTAIGSLFVPRMLERLGWKKTITLGAILAALGMFGMGLTHQVFVFNILGAIRGLGVAFCAMVPAAALINNWFEEKNGLALSIAAASGGIISVVFSPIFQRLIEWIGWEYTFMVHGLTILLLFAPAIFIPYTFHPEDEGLMPYGAKQTIKQSPETNGLKEPVRTKDFMGITFIALLLIAFLQTFAVGMGQHLPGFSASIGATPELASLTLSAVMIGNVSTKLIAGYLSDRIGVIKSIIAFSTVTIIAILLLITWSSNIGLLVSSLLYGTAYSGGVLHVLMTKEFFGARIGSYVNAPIVFISSLASAIGNVVIGYFYDYTGSYVTMFLTIIVLQLLAIFSLYIAQRFSSDKPGEMKEDDEMLIRDSIKPI